MCFDVSWRALQAFFHCLLLSLGVGSKKGFGDLGMEKKQWQRPNTDTWCWVEVVGAELECVGEDSLCLSSILLLTGGCCGVSTKAWKGKEYMDLSGREIPDSTNLRVPKVTGKFTASSDGVECLIMQWMR